MGDVGVVVGTVYIEGDIKYLCPKWRNVLVHPSVTYFG